MVRTNAGTVQLPIIIIIIIISTHKCLFLCAPICVRRELQSALIILVVSHFCSINIFAHPPQRETHTLKQSLRIFFGVRRIITDGCSSSQPHHPHNDFVLIGLSGALCDVYVCHGPAHDVHSSFRLI